MSKLNILIILFLLTNLSVYAVDKQFAVTNTGLNLRAGKSINNTLIRVLKKGDTVEIISQDQEWTKVKIDNTEGYVASNFIKNINYKNEETFEDQKGFIQGFKFVFYRAFIIVLILLLGYFTQIARKKDNRFKKGFKQGDITTKSWIISIALAVLAALLAGFVGGLISLNH
jgi:uncharacterized protein YgiM (DUF1202 family)